MYLPSNLQEVNVTDVSWQKSWKATETFFFLTNQQTISTLKPSVHLKTLYSISLGVCCVWVTTDTFWTKYAHIYWLMKEIVKSSFLWEIIRSMKCIKESCIKRKIKEKWCLAPSHMLHLLQFSHMFLICIPIFYCLIYEIFILRH